MHRHNNIFVCSLISKCKLKRKTNFASSELVTYSKGTKSNPWPCMHCIPQSKTELSWSKALSQSQSPVCTYPLHAGVVTEFWPVCLRITNTAACQGAILSTGTTRQHKSLSFCHGNLCKLSRTVNCVQKICPAPLQAEGESNQFWLAWWRGELGPGYERDWQAQAPSKVCTA